MAVDRIVVYSDYVCPFCYLGKVALDRWRAGREDAPEIAWRPFDLRGSKRRDDGTLDPAVHDGKDAAYYARAKAGVEHLARTWEVEMTFKLTKDVDSWSAQKLTLALGDDTREAARSHDLVFEALWKDGRDISEPDVLVALAREAGADPDLARAALDDPAWDDALRAAFRRAHERGIHAVPTYIIAGHALPGALAPEQLERVVAQFSP